MHTLSIPAFAFERGALMHPPKPVVARRTAVIAIDFQCFFIDEGAPMGNPHARDMLDTANRLHALVRQAGGRIVFTQHSIASPGAITTTEPTAQALLPGSPAYALHPALARNPADLCIVKHQSSPLHPRAGTRLEETLRREGITTVIVTGLVTNGCCDCTARDAFQHGFEVIVASDATAAMTDAEHNAALLNLELYYARVLDTTAIAAALGGPPEAAWRTPAAGGK